MRSTTRHRHLTIDINEMIRQLDKLRFGSGASPLERRRATAALADTLMPAFLQRARQELQEPPPPPGARGQPRQSRIIYSIFAGQRKYTSIRGPVLAMFADPLEAPAGARADPACAIWLSKWIHSLRDKAVRREWCAAGTRNSNPECHHFVFGRTRRKCCGDAGFH